MHYACDVGIRDDAACVVDTSRDITMPCRCGWMTGYSKLSPRAGALLDCSLPVQTLPHALRALLRSVGTEMQLSSQALC